MLPIFQQRKKGTDHCDPTVKTCRLIYIFVCCHNFYDINGFPHDVAHIMPMSSIGSIQVCFRVNIISAYAQQNQHLPSLIREALGPQLSIKCTAKTLIRLGRCLSLIRESSQGAKVILSCCGSFILYCFRASLYLEFIVHIIFIWFASYYSRVTKQLYHQK